ncbi:Arylsulfotransferase (ASST) [Halogeometricum borinquense DSM 11551]|uniref:Arylsulfotransferase (ASST) n=1 Tax=Halogeometricum borinquense (strain ATCC 700274 / DSM 11551 / JCM 10706 / KCTC 4070 / PR3) TaxID=469382 RepID=E4NM71_HALBP|nr:Arylsulfotransferase (ASST) [Halogeometricum borinquense DSM 11551]
MGGRTKARFALLIVLLLGSSTVASGYVSYESVSGEESKTATYSPNVSQELTAITVADSPHATAKFVVVGADNTEYYKHTEHDSYWDVDPVSDKKSTLLFGASETLSPSECKSVTSCRKNLIRTVNLTTGEVKTLYSRTYPWRPPRRIGRTETVQWHDVDRVNETHYLVADIARDNVHLLNIETGTIVWKWRAEQSFPRNGGGAYPYDWTHINDVELLDDGRIMASLRNQDQVVFLNRSGLEESWTLGGEDEFETIYEQHNPDYIPTKMGGPAVIVADSENNRIVEFQRSEGEWVESWTWQDRTMSWPRDADRLPNGNTLVTDTAAGRVIDLNTDGEIVWSYEIQMAYEAERLGTGDESAGGESAAALGLPSREPGDVVDTEQAKPSLVSRIPGMITSLFPNKLVHGVMFLLPGWVGVYELLGAMLCVGSLFTWGILEIRWRSVEIQFRNPIQFNR